MSFPIEKMSIGVPGTRDSQLVLDSSSAQLIEALGDYLFFGSSLPKDFSEIAKYGPIEAGLLTPLGTILQFY